VQGSLSCMHDCAQAGMSSMLPSMNVIVAQVGIMRRGRYVKGKKVGKGHVINVVSCGSIFVNAGKKSFCYCGCCLPLIICRALWAFAACKCERLAKPCALSRRVMR
jgi:hypothetical protein